MQVKQDDMQFFDQIGGMIGHGPGLAVLAGGGAVTASMIAAAMAWRRSFRKMTRLERAIAELEEAHSHRIGLVEKQLVTLRSEPSRTSDAQPSLSVAHLPIAKDAQNFEKPGSDNVSGQSNIVALRSPRLRSRDSQAAKPPSGEEIRRAIAEGRIESWFQPIVGLPGRTPRYYECHGYLRLETGDALPAPQWRNGQAAREMAGAIARTTLVECFALARKLRREKREGSIIWPLCKEAAADGHEHQRIMALLNANTSLRSRLLIGLDLADHENAGSDFEERLDQAAGLGFKFALAGGRNLDRIAKSARTGRFALVMLPHQTVLANKYERGASVTSILHGSDPGNHPEVAATGIDLEETAIELIDCDVLLAQGGLFSAPRPLRGKVAGAGGTASGNTMT